MWIITRATTNYVYPTCQEKQLLTGPSYIVKFIDDSRQKIRYCACTDSSTYTERNQKFTIVETTTPTAKTNQVKLDSSRSWKYIVYEISASALSALATIDETAISTLTEVDRGRVRVYNASSTSPQTYTGYQSSYEQYRG